MKDLLKSPNDWIKVSKYLPTKAIIGGRTNEDRPIYIGRSKAFGEILPVGVLQAPDSKKITSHIAHGSKETILDVSKNSCFVYCDGAVRWMAASNGNVPQGAVPVNGTAATIRRAFQETMYVGRAPYMGQLIVGKIHPSHECLYIPYRGCEIPMRDYEVLVKFDVKRWKVQIL